MRAGWVVVAVVAFVLGGCAPTLPPVEVSVPARDFQPSSPGVSTLTVETSVDLSPLGRAVDEALPRGREGRERVALGALGDTELRWAIDRAPARVGSERAAPGERDDRLAIAVELGLKVETDGGRLRCTSDGGALVVRASGAPAIVSPRPLVVGLSSVRVRIDVRGTLRCAGVPIPLPVGTVLGHALRPLAMGIEAALGALHIPLDEKIAPVVDALAEPRALEVAGEQACLRLDPRALVVGAIRSDGNGARLVAPLGVDVAPRLVLTACTDERPRPARPALGVVRRDLDDARFSAVARIGLPWTTVEKRGAALAGKRLGGGEHTVVLGAPSVSGAAHRLVVRVPVEGALRGTLVLWGTPSLSASGALDVPDLTLALETRSALSRLRFWALRAVDEAGLVASGRKALAVDLAGPLGEAKRALGMQIPVGGGTLTSSAGEVRAVSLDAEPGGLVLDVVLTGRATLAFPDRQKNNQTEGSLSPSKTATMFKGSRPN